MIDNLLNIDDIVYRIDEHDCIVFVNDAWDSFALQNDGKSLQSRHVLGRSLWDYITDESSSELYRQVLRKIRSGQNVSFTFRCDSPSCRRMLEMKIKAVENGLIEFCAHTLSTEQRDAVRILNAEAAHDSKTLLRLCSWCKRAHAGDEWLEIEDAIGRLELFKRPVLPSVTHGICEDCYRRMQSIVA